jgi:hypothetical protein
MMCFHSCEGEGRGKWPLQNGKKGEENVRVDVGTAFLICFACSACCDEGPCSRKS